MSSQKVLTSFGKYKDTELSQKAQHIVDSLTWLAKSEGGRIGTDCKSAPARGDKSGWAYPNNLSKSRFDLDEIV